VSVMVISDSIYFLQGSRNYPLGGNVTCLLAADMVGIPDYFDYLIRSQKTKVLVISVADYSTLLTIISYAAHHKTLRIIIEIVSIVAVPVINVCGILIVHRKLSREILIELVLYGKLTRQYPLQVNFDRLAGRSHYNTFRTLLFDVSYRLSMPEKTISRHKCLLAREMFLEGINSAVQLRLMRLYMLIYSIREEGIESRVTMAIGTLPGYLAIVDR